MGYFASMHAHSTYWNLKSASLDNMAYIVDGEYGDVTSTAGPGG